MSEVHVRREMITHRLLDFLGLRETPRRFAVEHRPAIQDYLEYTILARHQGYFRQSITQGEQRLLGQPGGTQHETALAAVMDFQSSRRVRQSDRFLGFRERMQG